MIVKGKRITRREASGSGNRKAVNQEIGGQWIEG